ncbi:Hint domain-containing protein [Rhodobacter calidifons]|uniref:Hint domain-containing protein n=1 Tax=Rhodobacter calidifons TaxID=2715277 RepID=A0ABX0GAS3_9RHOB|nr:Hint domain-containing protein [Rhodobacter calidifons]NHB78415.1 Hint domain-containing protein [Rhodobacter calidifons]
MAQYSVWILEKGNITVSGGGSLDGVTQGDGSHLRGREITLNSNQWVETFIEDNDPNFDDNDATQALSFAQTIDGQTYAAGTRVEAEYIVYLLDPQTGITYTAYAYNVNNSSPAYGTIEGLAFLGGANGFPPVGRPLTVVNTSEGPGFSGNPPVPYDQLAGPPCFTPGTLIDTVDGPRPVERLAPGDLIRTRDHGLQVLRWVARTHLTPADLRADPRHLPICIRAQALDGTLPRRDLRLSPQHRVLISGWKAELLFAEPEVLVPAVAFLGDRAVRATPDPDGQTYLHLLFDRHEIIFAEGAEVESLFPGWISDAALPPALRAELSALVPLGSDAVPLPRPARTLLTSSEGRLLTR